MTTQVLSKPQQKARLRLGPIALIVLLALISAGLIALWSGDPYALNSLTYTFLFAGLAGAWNIIGGYGGQFSLGHGAFLALAA